MSAQPIRILLGVKASAALTAAGESAFLIAGKASWPDDPSRWVLHLVPADMKQAADACLVALGQARAVKPRMPKPAGKSATCGRARETGPEEIGGTTP